MEILIRKLKPVVFLFTMIIVCIVTIFVVNQFKEIPEFVNVQENAQSVLTVENAYDVLNNGENISPIRVPENEESNEYMVVLSSTSSNNSCNTVNKIDSYSVCSRPVSVEEDFKQGTRSGDMVRKNASVILTEVTMPLEFLSGSDVKDSNRKLTSRTPVYKAAGEQLDTQVADVLLPPGSNIEEKVGWVENRPFGLKYSVGIGDKDSEQGFLGINKKIVNRCEECNNPSNVNPDKSNKIAEFMKDSLYRTPGEKEKIDSSKVIESCSSSDTYYNFDKARTLDCRVDVISMAVELVKSIAQSVWDECTRPPKYDQNGNLLPRSENCIYKEDIIVKMSSAFGSDKDCPDGVCTNTFMNTRNKVAMSPSDSSSYSDKVYYLTPCKALVDGKATNIKCAWDMSHLFKERKFSEFDDLPGIERTPSKESYNEFLLQDATKRSGQPAVEIF